MRELYRRAAEAARLSVGDAFEIVLVNDGSTDRTLEVMRSLAADCTNVVILNLSRNFGHQSALSAGLMHCSGERILVIDADLQDPPELLSEMMRIMDNGADVVYGQRLNRLGESRSKIWSAKLFYRLLDTLVDVDIPRDTGDFRLINRRTLETFKTFPEQFRFIRGLISWIGGKQIPMLYNRDSRFAGRTNYPLRKMIVFAADAVTGFSIFPLRLASCLGVLMGILSVLWLSYTFFSWLTGHAVTGWTSIMSAVLIIGSVQLLMLGIFGEYLGRLYMESKRRPLFIVHEIITGKRENMESGRP